MRRPPKYKVCRRLGPGIYEKCQSDKFAVAQSRVATKKQGGRRRRAPSEYGKQLMEKQRVRLTYGINERQFRSYIKEALAAGGGDTAKKLFELLESRLDNVVFRLGLAPTRAAARQLVSHGHITVNGKKIRVPSHRVRIGNAVGVRENSRAKTFFEQRREALKEHTSPDWVRPEEDVFVGMVKEQPPYDRTVMPFDLTTVLEFYSR